MKMVPWDFLGSKVVPRYNGIRVMERGMKRPTLKIGRNDPGPKQPGFLWQYNWLGLMIGYPHDHGRVDKGYNRHNPLCG